MEYLYLGLHWSYWSTIPRRTELHLDTSLARLFLQLNSIWACSLIALIAVLKSILLRTIVLRIAFITFWSNLSINFGYCKTLISETSSASDGGLSFWYFRPEVGSKGLLWSPSPRAMRKFLGSVRYLKYQIPSITFIQGYRERAVRGGKAMQEYRWR